MKKIRIWQSLILMLVCILLPVQLLRAEESEGQDTKDMPENLYAQSAVLMDADSGRVLFGKEEDVIRPMASTTKIMTCILALEQMKDGQTVTASEYAAGQPKVKLGVRSGEEFFLKDLLYSLMLESHNDSAVVIAEGIAGSVEAFADRMNQKAEMLGCEHTHFVTPNGLDGKDEGGTHSTTAEELARIMRYCIMESPAKEEFLKITGTRSYQFQNVEQSRSFSCNNHNAFLDMMDGAFTGKTGFTGEAGYCYVGALRRDERTFIVALLACGWPGNKGYKWADTRKLMEYGIEYYHYQDVWEELSLPEVLVSGAVSDQNPYTDRIGISLEFAKKDHSLRVLLGEGESIRTEKQIIREMEAPVEAGTEVGNVSYYLNNQKIGEFSVITLEAAKKRDLRWCLSWLVNKLCL